MANLFYKDRLILVLRASDDESCNEISWIEISWTDDVGEHIHTIRNVNRDAACGKPTEELLVDCAKRWIDAASTCSAVMPL